VRLSSLIGRFERNTRSRNPFGFPEVLQTAEPESTRHDAVPTATGIAIVSPAKQLMKLPIRCRGT
jgi:hypothetical protein